jgi:hypothetical protein
MDSGLRTGLSSPHHPFLYAWDDVFMCTSHAGNSHVHAQGRMAILSRHLTAGGGGGGGGGSVWGELPQVGFACCL